MTDDLDGSAQKSFRIRKYSRSLSSRMSLHSSRQEDASPDDPLHTIEIDNIRPKVALGDKKPKPKVKTGRAYKHERDQMATVLLEVKARFKAFSEAIQSGDVHGDTGGK